MGMMDNITKALSFKDTIFLKTGSDLQDKYDALIKLKEEYPNNKDLLNELNIVKKGLDGENEIAYQLKKANIGMYVLRDVKYKYGDLTAQIDYVVITPVYIYYIECKNLIGNIMVNEKGDFIRELTINNKTITKGMYSPLRQVEAQREVIRKIWESNANTINKLFGSNNFNYYRRVLVVVANQETILNTSKAPNNIKNKILRADLLVKKIEDDLEHKRDIDIFESKREMEKFAKSYLDLSVVNYVDYYNYYKKLFCNNLKERLISFRTNRSKGMNIPAYYVFTNEELNKIIDLKPSNVDELKNILPLIKVKTHGKEILKEINKN